MPERTIQERQNSCSAPSVGRGGAIQRRSFLGAIGAGGGAAVLPTGSQAIAGPFSEADVSDHLVPADKKLSAEWLASLTNRGQAEVFSGEQLKYVGMPVGGIGCGQLYLAGDGRLWLWDIFKCNYTRERGHGQRIAAFTLGGHYAHPVAAGEEYTNRNGADVAQGFEVRVRTSDRTITRTLDRQGFPDVTFRGEYPIGKVTYRDADVPVEVRLEAFSPFIPLAAKDSAIPATILSYTVTNPSQQPVEIDLGGWLQNATCPYTTDPALGQRRNRCVQADDHLSMLSTVEGEGVKNKHGNGSLALSLLHDTVGLGAGEKGLSIAAATSLVDPNRPGEMFDQATPLDQLDDAVKPLGELLVGGVFAAFRLAPGQSKTIDFAITWYFPDYNQKGRGRSQMLGVRDFVRLRRHYAPRFNSAADVAGYISQNKTRLLGGTRDWNQTWYDSTLPYWLLDRSFIPIDCIASQTFHWFDSGRPYAWEGVDCCPGTCTHVWHYAQALGRIFPEIERAFRERVDFKAGVGFLPETGTIGHRAENHKTPATDGQAGTILRVYREHQMSADDDFLKRVWPNVKKAIQYLIGQDGDGDGLLEGKQPHTLDASWYGPMGWLSGMYLAALAAGEAMATEMGDTPFATQCRTILDRGSQRIVEELFDGEYFIHKPDPNVRALNSNRGCHIDQVLGQAWMMQVGLGRVIPERETVSALNSLWKYNFAPDAGQYALDHVQIEKAFRWYAMPGEAGLLMCTWPKGGAIEAVPGDGMRTKANPPVYTGPGGYFNECMNGFEYQVAAHMVYEGAPGDALVEKGLAIAKSVHERYAAVKRNPYNEIECSDHYARSMASYGVFLAACGFTYHGPQGRIGFAPRVSPDHFKAPFTAAEGWGSFAQNVDDGKQSASIELRYGRLALNELSLEQVAGTAASGAVVAVDGKQLPAEFQNQQGRYALRFPGGLTLKAGQKLEVNLL
ncbi:GH116 family glycosyl-hydrolase [Rhodopirellula sp. JC639]|uniref:GH116 family glycosyl-hydrolase n=1 Tax=Stieleria mannarensis TaxID=2755585 RepID=UPI0016044008|nr:GH116 family glycosyl-hydrolase [Rhodopirellula sp. JC639]